MIHNKAKLSRTLDEIRRVLEDYREESLDPRAISMALTKLDEFDMWLERGTRGPVGLGCRQNDAEVQYRECMCGRSFEISSSNNRKKYCNNACRSRAQRARKNGTPTARTTTTCAYTNCEASLHGKREDGRFCSAACRAKHHRQRPVDNPGEPLV